MASLAQTFQTMTDPRLSSGRRHPLFAVLTHTTVAILAGARSYEAVVQFGRDRGPSFARAVGYTRSDMPCKATLSNIFRALPAGVFESSLQCWLNSREQAGWERASLDGKRLCGSSGQQLPGVHLLALFDHEAKAAIAQLSVADKTNEHKAALQMLDIIEVKGKVITGDAMFCQRDLSKKVVKKGALTSGKSRTTRAN